MYDLNSVLKILKRGRAGGIVIHAHIFVSLLINVLIRHGYLLTDFIKTAIVPIIKNQTRDTSDKTLQTDFLCHCLI